MYIRRSLIFGFVFALSIAMIGCAPRATTGQATELAGAEKAVIDIPALVIEYDADGNPSMGGMPLATLAPALGMDAAMIDPLTLPAEQMTMLTDGNVQHVQIDNATDGVLLMVNGEPIPSLVWDDATMANAVEVLEATGMGQSMLDSVLPFVRTTGVGLIAHFPVADGNAPIEAVRIGPDTADALSTAAREDYLASVDDGVPQLHLGVDYNEDGSWNVGGMSTDEWASTIEGVPWDMLALSPELLASAKNAEIESAFVGTNVDGILFKINDKDMPYVSWKHGEVTHLLRIAAQLGLLDDGLGENPEVVMDLIEQWLPAIQAADVKINVDFPSGD